MSKTIYVLLAVFLWAFSLPEPAYAQGTPLFSFPAQCEVGKTCFIFKYVDADAGPGYHDFNCSLRSSDGHKGTDIAITDPQDNTPIKVLAAADGVVVGLRDSLPDNPVGSVEFPKGQNCGNGVRIDHGDGWTTQYCHMGNGKVKVRNGQTVKRGRVIGFLGNSGQTERPHLHFQIEKDGVPVDPFTGKLNTSKSTCAKDKVDLAARSLWTESAQNKVRLYRPYVIEYIGLSTQVLAMETVLQRRHPVSGGAGDPLMIVYSSILGARKGTTLTMEILDPDGETFFSHSEAYEEGRARQFRYAGKKRPDATFKSGAWTARVTISGTGLSGPYEETRTATFAVN